MQRVQQFTVCIDTITVFCFFYSMTGIIRDVGAGVSASDLPSPPLNVGADHQFPALPE
jgi:hypothetical protein